MRGGPEFRVLVLVEGGGLYERYSPAVKQVKKATHYAVVCGMSTSPHEASCTVRYVYDVIPHLPMQCCCAPRSNEYPRAVQDDLWHVNLQGSSWHCLQRTASFHEDSKIRHTGSTRRDVGPSA